MNYDELRIKYDLIDMKVKRLMVEREKFEQQYGELRHVSASDIEVLRSTVKILTQCWTKYEQNE